MNLLPQGGAAPPRDADRGGAAPRRRGRRNPGTPARSCRPPRPRPVRARRHPRGGVSRRRLFLAAGTLRCQGTPRASRRGWLFPYGSAPSARTPTRRGCRQTKIRVTLGQILCLAGERMAFEGPGPRIITCYLVC